MEYLVVSLVFAPLLLGIVLFFVKGDGLRWSAALLGSGLLLVISLLLMWQKPDITFHVPLILPLSSHMGIGFATNSFALLYAPIACGAWLVSIVISKDYFSKDKALLNRYYAAIFLALSGTMGVFFAWNLFTLVFFFEIMSLSSYLWVLHKQDQDAIDASNIYLSFGIAGGLCILYGIFALTPYSQSLEIATLSLDFAEVDLVWPCFFLLLGFGAKAGLFFIHDWMPTSYTASPAPATGLLSGILSKCGVYGILVFMLNIIPLDYGFAKFLMVISVFNMLIGGVAALLSGNLKRTLAFSSVSQMGFIFWGIAYTNMLGYHNTVAAYGTLFHMINHSLIKVLLFSLSGLVLCQAKTLELDDLRGFGRGKPWFQGLFLVGASATAGIPLCSGYVSKTLLHESVVEFMYCYPTLAMQHFYLYEWAFLLAGGLTTAYMLKLYFCFFREKGDKEWQKTPLASKKTMIALSAVAGILLILGLTPNISFGFFGEYTSDFFGIHPEETIDYFSWTNLKGSLTSLLLGAVIFMAYYSYSTSVESSMYQEKIKPTENFIEKLYLPAIGICSLVLSVLLRLFDVALEAVAQRVSQRGFKALEIPETFFYGEDNVAEKKNAEVHISQSLAFSLLMFGIGFIFTIVYLLVVGGTLSY